MSFIDRMFLGWYSSKALAAALPSAAMSFTVASFFMGAAGYAGTFVAQYVGAKQKDKIGPVLWQGLYFSIITIFIVPVLWFCAPMIFGPFQSDPVILKFEIDYFNLLNLGLFPLALIGVLSGFWSGRAKPWPLLWINFIATLVNLGLDYVLIFGKFGFPEWGIKGAAIATVIAQILTVVCFIILMLPKATRVTYGLGNYKFNFPLLKSLLVFGTPAGIHFFVDVLAFTLFTLVLGMLGEIELASSNIALQVHFLAFLPLMGIGMGIQMLVGQYMGQKKPEYALKTLKVGVKIVTVFMGIMAVIYLSIPTFFTSLFMNGDPNSYGVEFENLTVTLLKFCAFFSFVDGLQVLFASHLKGAGDTSFVMKMLMICGTFILVVPSALLVYFDVANIYMLWSILSIYMFSLGAIMFFRIKKGYWKTIDMIG